MEKTVTETDEWTVIVVTSDEDPWLEDLLDTVEAGLSDPKAVIFALKD